MDKYSKTVMLEANDENDTAEIARLLAKHSKGSSLCIELVGDVGAGKTTFTQSFVASLGSSDTVTSPTFTLENVYHCESNVVYHFDLYRLQESGLIPEEVNEALSYPMAIVVIEWADLLTSQDKLPQDRTIIWFESLKRSENARKITIMSPNHALIHELNSKVAE